MLHYGNLFFRWELERLRDAINKTLSEYNAQGITDDYIEQRDIVAMERFMEEGRISRLSNIEKKQDDLYLILDVDANLLKIGRSIDVKKRLQQLKTANGHKLVLLCVVKNKGDLEEQVQEEFSFINTNGEWYKYSQDIINKFVSLGGTFFGDTTEKKSKRFVKPSVEEIQAHILEKGYTFDAEAFYAFYESNGWKVGRNPMKNWKMACTTWAKNNRNNKNNNYGRETITDKIRRTIEEANKFSQQLADRIGDNQQGSVCDGDTDEVW